VKTSRLAATFRGINWQGPLCVLQWFKLVRVFYTLIKNSNFDFL